MKRAGCVLAFALCAAWAPDRAWGGTDKKPTPEPFYRKYLVVGDPLDDKIAEQERRVEASPNDANLRNDFGNLLAERKFPAQAAEQYEIAMKLDPKNFISAYNLGLVRETEGKVSDAMSAYQRSIKRKPGFPQSHFRLGRLYEETNSPGSAVREYAAAMWIDPGMRDPKRNPLIIDSQLIYLASLANYQRDVAVAALTDSHVYFDNDRFRKLPTTRAISAKEAEGDEDADGSPAPRDVGSPGSTGAAGTSEPARRGSRTPPPSAQRPPTGLRRTPVPARTQAGPAPGAPGTAPGPGGPAAVEAAPAPAPADGVQPAPASDAPAEPAPEPTGAPADVEPS
jgi:Tetratricopeptide repeat